MNEQRPSLLPRPVRVPSEAIDAENLLPKSQSGDNRRRRRRSSAIEPPVKQSDRTQAQPDRPAIATFSDQVIDVSKIKPEMPDIFELLNAKAQEIHDLLVDEGNEFNLAQVKYALCEWIEESITALVNDAEWHCVIGHERYSSNRSAFDRALRRAVMKRIVAKPDDVNCN